METELTADGQLRIGNTLLNAEATGVLIQRLAKLRAQMHPPVTTSWAAIDEIDFTHKPGVKIGLSRDGLLLLALRHDGFGWCCFELELSAAASLRDFIAKRTSGVNGDGLERFVGPQQ